MGHKCTNEDPFPKFPSCGGSGGLSVWRRGGAQVTLCVKHYQPINRIVGYCWKCASSERDPPLDAGASWWWKLERYFCRCTDSLPSPTGTKCLRCGLALLVKVFEQVA